MRWGGQPDWETTAYEARVGDAPHIIRVRLRHERGQVVRFTVQYEADIEGEAYPVIRHDNAHGIVHRDTLDAQGRVLAKDWFEDKTNAQVLTEAIAGIKANWEAYRAAFVRRKS